MTEAEKRETLARIEAAEKGLAEIKAKVQNDDEVPNALEWNLKDCEEGWCIDSSGSVFKANSCLSASEARKRRLFKTEKYAQMFAKKTQFIADLLHFKWLYDRDYEPDWTEDRERKYFVVGYHDLNKWVVDYVTRGMVGGVYFSSEEIAQKCADWLNRKAGII